MAPEQPLDPFIAAIELKIAKWTAVLESYKAAVAIDGAQPGDRTGSQVRRAGGDTGGSVDLPVGVFRDKSLKEAIAIYLGAGRRKQTNKEIAIGLQRGGIATTSVNFEATVATALGRMKDEGTILRFLDGWDLAASYPDSLRSRLEKDAKPQKRRRGKRSGASSKREPKAPRVEQRQGYSGDSKTNFILGLLSTDSSSGKTIPQVVDAVRGAGMECTLDYARVVLKRLRKRGQVVAHNGQYYRADAEV